MHRNTLIFIIILGAFAALVVGVNLGRNSSQPATDQPSTSTTPAAKLVTVDTCGIQFSYPENLTKVDIQTGGATLFNPEKAGDTIVVVCQQEIPRVPLAIEKMETIAIGSTSATLFHDASQKDGTPVDKLIFTHPTLPLMDVYIAGFGDTFNALIKTIQIKSDK